jgi:cell wall-associated NlpC family hydrolase
VDILPRISLLACALTCLAVAAAAPAGAALLELPQPETVEPAPKPSLGARAVRIAQQAVGLPYRYGGESPASGFDCSGLVRWAYGQLDVELPHSSYALAAVGREVDEARMRPGDVLVFAGLGHVGLYVGRGRMVHAPQSGRTVEVVTLGATGYGARLVTARRISRS